MTDFGMRRLTLAVVLALLSAWMAIPVRAAGVEPASSPAVGIAAMVGVPPEGFRPAIAPAHAPASYARTADSTPTPVALPSPSAISEANHAPVSIGTQLGGMVTLLPDGGTTVTPTAWVEVDGPVAVSNLPLARIYSRLGITSAPGTTVDLANVQTYKAAEVGLGLRRVIGAGGGTETSVVAEYGFSSILKGASDPKPLNRLVRSAGAGVRLDAPSANASLTVLLGYDEASTSCAPPVICNGIHSGLAAMAYGQAAIPATGHSLVLLGDVTIALGQPTALAPRRDVFRLGLVVSPGDLIKAIQQLGKKQPAP